MRSRGALRLRHPGSAQSAHQTPDVVAPIPTRPLKRRDTLIRRPPGFFPLFGIPIVLVGLGLLLSPFWAFHKATRTVYAVPPGYQGPTMYGTMKFSQFDVSGGRSL